MHWHCHINERDLFGVTESLQHWRTSRCATPHFTLTGREDGAKAEPKQGRATIATMEAIFILVLVIMCEDVKIPVARRRREIIQVRKSTSGCWGRLVLVEFAQNL